MQNKIRELKDKITSVLNKADSLDKLEKIRIEYMGKKGILTNLLKKLKDYPVDLRREYGKGLNEFKKYIMDTINGRKKAIINEILENRLKSEWIDLTIPKRHNKIGYIHPITAMQYEIEDIFRSMGFMVLDGPWMEDDYHNFEALNIPADHPARDMQDTFWLENGRLLRTHTSCVQIRAMERFKPPIRAIAPGRVFRYEATDASHENTFYQVEGLVIDRDVSVANLIYTMKILLKQVFKQEVEVRLRPGYFPFVEPGFELDIRCLICKGKGCSVCKHSGWVEILPCGLVHPNVLKYGNIDPDEFSGFAFGLGLNRLVMMRYGIDDIRYFQNPDIRFLMQF